MAKNHKTKSKLTSPQDIFVSLVMVTGDTAHDISSVLRSIQQNLAKRYSNYEIIVVANGIDVGGNLEVSELLTSTPCVRIIRLSYKTHYDAALFAGLEAAIGDYTVTFNPDIDGIESIEGIIEANKKADIIQGISKTPLKGVFGTQIGRRAFYWYNRKYIGVDIPVNATYFASYSRRAVNALTSLGRSVRHVRHLSRMIGFKIEHFTYVPKMNPSRQRSLRTGGIEALEIITSYSSHPLRFVTWLGVFASVVNLLFGGYVVALNVLGVQVAEGWTTTSLQSSIMFFFLFLILVVLIEYIGRIMTETRKDPSYFVADELISTVPLADINRRNIEK